MSRNARDAVVLKIAVRRGTECPGAEIGGIAASGDTEREHEERGEAG